MYGADRLAAAKAKYGKPVASSADAARAGARKPSKPVAKSADAARAAANKTSTKSAKPMAKKSGTTDPFAKFVFDIPRALKEPFTSKKNK
jgi:hypothetical protein